MAQKNKYIRIPNVSPAKVGIFFLEIFLLLVVSFSNLADSAVAWYIELSAVILFSSLAFAYVDVFVEKTPKSKNNKVGRFILITCVALGISIAVLAGIYMIVVSSISAGLENI